VIDGLPEGLFAIYHKMHHAYADGVTMSRWTAEGFSTSPTDMAIDAGVDTQARGLRHSACKGQ
jgi:hypothetical protein